MAVAAPPKPPVTKGKKSGALPDGLAQPAFDDLLAALSQAPDAQPALPLLKAGDPVTWRQVPRGGYGYSYTVAGVVVKVGTAKVTIRVQRRDGTFKEIAVKPDSLLPRRAASASEQPPAPASPLSGSASGELPGLFSPTEEAPAGRAAPLSPGARPAQLGFDSLEPGASNNGGTGSGWEVIRQAQPPGRRKAKKKPALPEGITQSSLFDDLLTTTSPSAYVAHMPDTDG